MMCTVKNFRLFQAHTAPARKTAAVAKASELIPPMVMEIEGPDGQEQANILEVIRKVCYRYSFDGQVWSAHFCLSCETAL